MWSWHQHSTDGEFESITSINEDGRDAVYVIVKRTINGSTVRYIERMEPRYVDDAANSFFVDSGLTYSGTPVSTISGADHLEGEEVAILADGNVVTGKTVSGGQVTLPFEASTVHLGLAYTPAIELLDIDPSSASEALKGRFITVSRVHMEVENSRGGWVGPIDDDGNADDLVEIKPRFESDSYDPIALKSFQQEVVIQDQWAKGGGIRIEQRAPLPLAILSVIPDVDVGG